MKGQGRGWFGDPQGHSDAARKGWRSGHSGMRSTMGRSGMGRSSRSRSSSRSRM